MKSVNLISTSDKELATFFNPPFLSESTIVIPEEVENAMNKRSDLLGAH